MAEPRIRRVQTQREFDTVVDDYVTQGYEIRNRGESSALVRKKSWGTGGMHALVFLLTSWWTFCAGNLVYALYAHTSADQVLVRMDAAGSPSPVAAPTETEPPRPGDGGTVAAAMLAIALSTVLVACGGSTPDAAGDSGAAVEGQAQVEEGTDGGDESVAEGPTVAPEPTKEAVPTKEPEPTEEPEPTTEPTPSLPSFADGTHAVGADIQPGVYRIADVGSSCYWARLSGFSGDFGELIANDNASGSAVVEILESDAGFESNDCGTWVMDSSRVTDSTTSFGEGTYLVGVDFEPGQYRNSGGGSCYWARLTNFRGDLDSIASNDNVDAQTIVDILASDVGFTSKDCGTWEKVQ